MCMISLNLRHLEAVAAIRRERSFGAAACEINLTQSALTQAIAGLEKRIGVRLFERGARGTEPTRAGNLLADSIERATKLFNSAALNVSRRPVSTPTLSRMTGTQLLSLTAVERAGSFRGGARTSGLTQASVHEAVRSLEASLGIDLFVKNKSGIDSTPAAVVMARAARQVMTEIHAGLDAARETSVRKFAVGLTPLGGAQLFPEAVAKMYEQDPHICFQVEEAGYPELEKRLLDGEIDMIIGGLPKEASDGLKHHVLSYDQLLIVAGKDHPLADRVMVDLNELVDFPWILSPVGTPRRERWDAMFDAGRIIPPVPRVECTSARSIRGLLMKGDWLSVLAPSEFASDDQLGSLVAIHGPVVPTLAVGIAMRADWAPTEIGVQMLNALSEVDSGASWGPPVRMTYAEHNCPVAA